jgi:hypothetical protein
MDWVSIPPFFSLDVSRYWTKPKSEEEEINFRTEDGEKMHRRRRKRHVIK